MGDGYKVNYPGLAAVGQALADTHVGLLKVVDQTGPDCTAVAYAYPDLATSSALRTVHAAHAAHITGHANDIGGYATDVHAALAGYSAADLSADHGAAGIQV